MTANTDNSTRPKTNAVKTQGLISDCHDGKQNCKI